MNVRFALELLSAIAVGGSTVAAQATMVWDEGASGDLSDSGLAPTSLIVTAGSNLVVGDSGRLSGSDIDRDYFSFTVSPGLTWTGLTLLGNTAVAGGFSFVAIEVGPQITASPTGASASELLGWAHYGNAQIGTNLLPAIVAGFPGALPSGTYALWVQDTGGLAPYGFDIGVSGNDVPIPEVPLPAAALSLLGGLFGLTAVRRLASGRG